MYLLKTIANQAEQNKAELRSEWPIHSLINLFDDVEEKSMIDRFDEDITYVESLFSTQIWYNPFCSNQ